ncbi:MAG: type II toxin-antitoxin system VapC family toxin [Chthoniobacterales bacterium]|nr:type II toxin-antitoxin system VapC family toxin [Chthoniobacterales bacterium]
MNAVLDSSGWIELLAGSDRARLFEPALRADRLFVPAIVRYEVGRYTFLHQGIAGRELALTALSKFEQVPIDDLLADAASELANVHKLAMADALVYASAQTFDAELWTQDKHFQHLPGVKFFRKA